MRKSMILPVLLLSLLLTACGGEEAGSGRNSFWEELGVEETETVLTVDGREVPAWRYGWWLAEACSAMEAACAAGGLAVDWDTPLEEGTLGAYVERQALENTVLYAVVESRAAEWGAVLSAEPTGEGVRSDAGVPLEDWQRQELELVGLLFGELCAMAAAEDSPWVTRETLEAFAAAEGYVTLDTIAFPAGEDRSAARQQAEEAFARLNNAGDKGAIFAALSAADGSAETETLRLEGDGLEPVLASAASALAVEQHSGILETESGFCILRRLPPERAALAPLWLEGELLQAAERAAVETAGAFRQLTAAAMAEAVKDASAK